MNVKMIRPATAELVNARLRPIKYSMFPPLGLATLAGYLDASDDISLVDEHVEPVPLDDEPDVVAIQVHIASAYRAYDLADRYRRRGAHVCLGGPHVTALPEEAARHADTVFLGPGEDTWPAFLADFRAGRPRARYQSTIRDLRHQPRPRRDLLKRQLYLMPNATVVSRGCPHLCDFCYVGDFYRGGERFYHQAVDRALAEIADLPGRHLYFLDDHLLAKPPFAEALFEGMLGMGRAWQAAGTVESVLRPGLVEKAAASGLRGLFIGFETLSADNLVAQHKTHNLNRDYRAAIRKLHGLGVMVNASFIFGFDEDDGSVFDRTVEWAIENGIETATFHILTPYPGSAFHDRLRADGRILTDNWDLYDARHAVFRPARMSVERVESGYHRAYEEFYRWGSIFRSARAKATLRERLKHVAFTAAWKKLEWLWDWLIRTRRLGKVVPLLERALGSGRKPVQRRGPAPVFSEPNPSL